MQAIKTYFFIATLASLAGCVQNQKTDLSTLVIGIESEVLNMDLRSTTDANAMHIGELFSQSLVKLGADLLPHPDLALSYDIDAKALRYVFHLPPDLRFHDGHPLTCEDVDDNFKEAAGPKSMIRSSFEDVASFACESPLSFVITLKKARASFLVTEVAAIRIYPKHASAKATFGAAPIGSGPYRFVKKQGRDLIFERFEAYKNHEGEKPLPFFKKIIVRSIEDPTTRLLSLMGGDVDVLVNALSPLRVVEAEKSPFLKVFRSPGTTYQYIGLNLRLPKLQDPRVRRALALGLDRRNIIKHKLLGYASLASSVLSPQNPFSNPGLPEIPYDPEKAKALLKEAGAQEMELELKIATDRDIASMALVLKEQWEKLGLKVSLRPYEFATFFSDIRKGNFEVFSLRWTGVSDPGLLNQIFDSKELPPGKNRVAYKNLLVDRLLTQGQSSTELEERKKAYFKVQEIIAADLPYISLWYPDNIAVVSRSLKNFSLHPTGQWLDFVLNSKKEL